MISLARHKPVPAGMVSGVQQESEAEGLLLPDALSTTNSTGTHSSALPLSGHPGAWSWDLGMGLLKPDGPADQFFDSLLALAMHSPARFALILALIVSGAAFLALVRALFDVDFDLDFDLDGCCSCWHVYFPLLIPVP